MISLCGHAEGQTPKPHAAALFSSIEQGATFLLSLKPYLPQHALRGIIFQAGDVDAREL
jgi:hypothetical protein